MEEMQKNRQIVKKTGGKGKETRRFDKFVITRKFAFINQESGRYKPKLGDPWRSRETQKVCVSMTNQT